ncbi:hypothetical protein SAMD00019534_033830 [Acytostelium subglobosum LB1]|uniref:hypothetical protein n=1 Tax=Acytostelium subglobosum LB1 TaxID=1410327 RepID=UPI000644AC97|nr:hypothetical protein SAMD00019534_033830 [Acytostelium subglobosum LB1]GAM20208.1 hypothetical protein SAMD00019534_033830 [Acytostelium subglobosum LB1]|eukprot:XP_012759729.1 hypothetical protein SAMD00019534_033830 [Acytostelium subglobosum LB1]
MDVQQQPQQQQQQKPVLTHAVSMIGTTTSTSTTNTTIPISPSTGNDVIIKLVFPPTSSVVTKTIQVRLSQKASEIVAYASQLAGLQNGYSLYIQHSRVTSRGQWVDDDAPLSEYSINNMDNIYLKRRPGLRVRKNTYAQLKGFKEGKVQKLSSFTKIWNPRFLRLYSQRIVHTSNENDSNSEFISFSDIINVDRELSRKYSFVIRYYSTPQTKTGDNTGREEKDYVFRCTNQAEMEEWVSSIRTMLKKSRPDLFLPPLSVPMSSTIDNSDNNMNIGGSSSSNNIGSLSSTMQSSSSSTLGHSPSISTKGRSFSFSLSAIKKKRESPPIVSTSYGESSVLTIKNPEEELKKVKAYLEKEMKTRIDLEKKYRKLKHKYSNIKMKNHPPLPGAPSASTSSSNLMLPPTTTGNSASTTATTTTTTTSSSSSKTGTWSGSGFLTRMRSFSTSSRGDTPKHATAPKPESPDTTNVPTFTFSTPKSVGPYSKQWTPSSSPFTIGSARLKGFRDYSSEYGGGGGSTCDITSSTDTLSVIEEEYSSAIAMGDDLRRMEIKDMKEQLAKVKDMLATEISKRNEAERDKLFVEKELFKQRKIVEKKERELVNEKSKQDDQIEALSEMVVRLKDALIKLKSQLIEQEELAEERQHDLLTSTPTSSCNTSLEDIASGVNTDSISYNDIDNDNDNDNDNSIATNNNNINNNCMDISMEEVN